MNRIHSSTQDYSKDMKECLLANHNHLRTHLVFHIKVHNERNVYFHNYPLLLFLSRDLTDINNNNNNGYF